ncbi:hypothetical protein MASR1M31_03370 [Porphyromonadaceae bacterium]
MIKGIERLQEFMNDQAAWSDQTFDGGNFRRSRSIAISHHLQKEAVELTESFEKFFQDRSVESFSAAKEEIADCFILLVDCASHLGCDADELITACQNKLEKNKKRVWGEPDENGVIEHLK